jgi:hypothetical protein
MKTAPATAIAVSFEAIEWGTTLLSNFLTIILPLRAGRHVTAKKRSILLPFRLFEDSGYFVN